MPYIDSKYLFKCETCRNFIDGHGCTTFCDSGECYSPNMNKIPTADVAPRAEIAEIFEKIEKLMFGYMVLPLNTLAINYDEYTELKKKYTEGKTDGKM